MAIYRDTTHACYFLQIDNEWFRKKGKIYNYRPVARAHKLIRLEKNGEGQVLKDRDCIDSYRIISSKDMLLIMLNAKDI
jgi:hypothetical protein